MRRKEENGGFMKKSILKALLVVSITSGCVCCLLTFAEGVARDGTTFFTNSSGNTVIDHRGRNSSHSVVEIDKSTGRKVTTSN